MLVHKYFPTWLLIGWQPIFLTDMDLVIQPPGAKYASNNWFNIIWHQAIVWINAEFDSNSMYNIYNIA